MLFSHLSLPLLLLPILHPSAFIVKYKNGPKFLNKFPNLKERHLSSSSSLTSSPINDPTSLEALTDFSKTSLSPYERSMRTVKFWTSAVPILLDYYKTYTSINVNQAITGVCLSDEECAIQYDEIHDKGAIKLKAMIDDLKGFYVKTGQVIASRQDLFPRAYTEQLSGLTDFLDPMPIEIVRQVILKELVIKNKLGNSFDEVFASFDEIPLGAASVAQVHKATLTSKFGGGVVAVKVQRPSIEPKLLGDIKNLKALSLPLRGKTPVDYWVVFNELEEQLKDEFDFIAEAQAMTSIKAHLQLDVDGTTRMEIPLEIPDPIDTLVSKRVLCMTFLEGVPLSRAKEEMEKKGIDPDGPESKLFGKNLLTALTYVFGRGILETGFFHADPHPGNIFVLDDGKIGLIDFGQVKQISKNSQLVLAKTMVALDDRSKSGKDLSVYDDTDVNLVTDLSFQLGVRLKEGAPLEVSERSER